MGILTHGSGTSSPRGRVGVWFAVPTIMRRLMCIQAANLSTAFEGVQERNIRIVVSSMVQVRIILLEAIGSVGADRGAGETEVIEGSFSSGHMGMTNSGGDHQGSFVAEQKVGIHIHFLFIL